MSNISVSVAWDQPTVFAGEELRCTITFCNAAFPNRSRSPSPNSQLQGLGAVRERRKTGTYRSPSASESPTLARPPESRAVRPQRNSRRSTISLSAPVGINREVTDITVESGLSQARKPSKHNRSVSIISIGSQPGAGEEQALKATPNRVRGIQKTHGRSASYQGLPLRAGPHNTSGNGTPVAPSPTPPSNNRSATSPYPLQKSVTIKEEGDRASESRKQHNVSPAAAMALERGTPNHHRSGSESRRIVRPPEFFKTQKYHGSNGKGLSLAPSSVREHNTQSEEPLTSRAIQRMLSPMSTEGTPRGSVDLYTQSNNSSETLASEYVPSSFHYQRFNNRHTRQASHLAPFASHAVQQDVLMMGYVQIIGSFILDGSLVTMAPFEAVKRKGVIGGQGSGGVVGLGASKRDSGLFGTLGWGNIGQSLHGLLGPQEPSSLREMKGLASSKSIPLMSTPQSILFVDLKLKPGESKSYTYSHVLPEGLPPSHKGRAFKSSYHLVVGIQRAQSSDKQHMVRQVDIPFRVLPGVDGAGNAIAHDLMSPHILLTDMASTRNADQILESASSERPGRQLSVPSSSTDGGFNSYVDSLLRKSRQNSNLSLLSPTELPTPGSALPGDAMSIKDRIDMTIVHGSLLSHPTQAANRFQIHRDGVKVANVILGRSAYRLGETVWSIIDMTAADIPCYAVNVFLETTEIIEPALALRSAASIHRATRRIHASCSQNVVSARRLVFGTIIPLIATPGFSTSGMRLDWKLRFEFITGCNPIIPPRLDEVLEKVTEDDRGVVAAAVQELPCESFDVAVPIRVFGVQGSDDISRPCIYRI